MLGIVILNYNTWEETINCIESIISHTSTKFKIYVVDNQSPEKATTEQLASLESHDVELIMNSSNSGYAAGNNVGLKKAYADGCRLFLISNSDVIIEDDSIDKLCTFITKTDDAEIAGPLIYDLNGERQPIHMLSKLTAPGKIKNMLLSTPLKPLLKKFQNGFVMHEKPEKPLKVFGVSGCCFLITRKCYETIFPFDEHTFLYEEEYILGCRAEAADIGVYIVPDAHIVHAEAVSTGGMSKFSYRCLIDSEQYYLKNYIHSNWITRKVIMGIRNINWYLIYKSRS